MITIQDLEGLKLMLETGNKGYFHGNLEHMLPDIVTELIEVRKSLKGLDPDETIEALENLSILEESISAETITALKEERYIEDKYLELFKDADGMPCVALPEDTVSLIETKKVNVLITWDEE